MAQTINADDGVISGSAGLKSSSDGTAILSLQTKGTTALTVDGSQNVGIGTSSPGYKLDVRGVTASGNGTITTGFTYDTRGLVGTFSNHALGFITNGSSPTMVLDTSGNLGVGNTSPAYRLHLSSAIDTYAFCVRDTIGNDRLLIGSRASAPIDNITPVQIANDNDGNLLLSSRTNNASGIKFYSNAGTAAVERARITSGGAFLVGTTTTDGLNNTESVGCPKGFGINRNATDFAERRNWAISTENNEVGDFGILSSTTNTGNATTLRLQVTRAGSAYNTTGTWGTISDERFKQDIVDAPSQWGDIKAIRFRKYRMKADVEADSNAPELLGVVAQELEQVCPGLVDGENVKTVKSSILLMKAAVALQEAMTRIEQLEAKVAALESK